MTEDPIRQRIAAVVVTFNRLALLQRLVARAGRGRRGSTRSWSSTTPPPTARGSGCAALAATQPACRAGRTLTDNTGGAGGFHEGLRWAVERGADLVWLMDDDGLPDADCLATLLAHAGDLDFWGPVVVDEADPEPAGLPDPAARRHPRRARDGRRRARPPTTA